MAQIYIYSGPTHSGKTSRLETWIGKIQSIDGILMPTIDNKRYIKYIHTGEVELLETDTNNPDLVQRIGNYRFENEVFQKAQNYLLDLIHKRLEWIIIDEVGFLELDGQGFEPAVSKVIQEVETKQNINLLLVIRDYLKDQILDFYKLDKELVKDFQPE
jgi:nucleoside-triphosphatase THEP1